MASMMKKSPMILGMLGKVRAAPQSAPPVSPAAPGSDDAMGAESAAESLLKAIEGKDKAGIVEAFKNLSATCDYGPEEEADEAPAESPMAEPAEGK